VALTFDDGPNERYTPRILRVLRRFDVPATFFVVGYLAERYPDLVEREDELGMTVGSHSMHHPYRPPFHRLPRRQVAAEIRQPTKLLARLGVTVKAFRPPGGAWSPRVLEEAKELDQRLVLWSVDSRDWAGLSAKQIAAGVLQAVEPGSIVLLHDGGGDRSATVAALPRIIKGLRRKNLQPVAI
jgi:peptidoglycan/xylan/chitin deacetylase (PgdA/CDA1 family)